MIIFSALVPHPPIIIPEIGGEETKKVKETISAMKKLADKLEKSDPDTIIVISPHTLAYPDRFNICGMNQLKGNLAHFGAPQVSLEFENDLQLVKKIDKSCEKHGVSTLLYDNGDHFCELDHGITVPLYFLIKNLGKTKIISIALSMLDKNMHFAFGEVIGEISQKSSKRIAIVASGDLSHRLIQTAPGGYSEAGKEFDELLINYLKDKDAQGILEMDEDFLEDAGECGYRSLLILLGAIDKLNYKPQILSYEGPFGVGYTVVNFKL